MGDSTTDLVKALATGGAKGILAELAVKGIDEAQFIQMFIDAGKHVSEYEHYKTEESEWRKEIFGESSMRTLARMMRSIDDYSWMDALGEKLDEMLAGLEENNRQNCKEHFLKIIETSIRRRLPEKYERYLLQDIDSGMMGIMNQMQGVSVGVEMLLEDLEKRRQEERQHTRQEQSENRESYVCRQSGSGASKFYIPEWNLTYPDVEWEPGMTKQRRDDIVKLVQLWSKERGQYPLWYIPPYAKCVELERKTTEVGLLQCYASVELETLLAFCYELVWRYEICMHMYSEYENKYIHIIWNTFGEEIKGWGQKSLDDVEVQQIEQWFAIGQALLRSYREEGMDEEWEEIYRGLKSYADHVENGLLTLRIEKLKLEYHHMNLPAMRRALGHCNPKKHDYEQRLQILGMRVELGEAEMVIDELKQLQEDIRQAGIEHPERYLYFSSLQACTLQLYSLCVQGVRDYAGEYEAHQEAINRIEDEIEENKELFDWTVWINQTKDDLLRWHVKCYEQKEPFELDRYFRTLFGGTSGCTSAYRFFRLLDKLALPLRCGYVTVLGDWEHPWMEAVLELRDTLGVFLLCRSSRSNTIETLIDREYISSLQKMNAEKLVVMLLHAFSKNLDEMEERDEIPGGLLSQIMSNVPELLVRFMSRCPAKLQEEALYLLKALMENESLPVSFPMAKLCLGITKQVSERVKARMLDTMLQTKIVEHKTLHGHGEGMDLLACYFRRSEIGTLKKFCRVDPQTIAWLLEIPRECGYVWKTKVLRLEILDTLGLLNETQRQAYAKMVWLFVSEKTGLPMLSNMHLFAFEKMPCVDANIPVRSLKNFFLSQKLEAQFDDKEGCKGTMGSIPYLDELILLCDNMESGYWSLEEANRLLDNIVNYWAILKVKWEKVREDSFVWDEYRDRARKMVQCAAAITRNVGKLQGNGVESLQQMIDEMQQFRVSTKELEVQMQADEELPIQIANQMQAAERELAVGAIKAAFEFIMAHPDTADAQMLLEEIMRLICYRKMPGMVSAVWVIHNLIYMQCPIMNETNLSSVDDCLRRLADFLRTDMQIGLPFKDVLNTRKACVAVAFQMSRLHEAKCGEGVLRWKVVAEDEDEINEVKYEW